MKPLPLLLLLCSTCSYADTAIDATGRRVDCAEPLTTLEVNACLGKEADKADAELNRIYKLVKIYVKAHDDEWNTVIDKRPPSIQLRDAQRLWIKQRDADCSLVYSLYHQGTIRNTKAIVCSMEQTKKRTAFLQSLLPRN